MNLAKKLLLAFWDFFETIIVALVIFLVCYIWLFQPHKVQGQSMYPTFHDGDYILTNKITYRFNDPKPGDIVVFVAPDNPEYDYIKRIIAQSGDRVKIIDKKFYVNGYILNESNYLDSNVETFGESFLKEGEELVVPPGYFFVAGDNRSHSSDSRDFGPIAENKIVGKAWFRYWPIGSFGLIKQEDLVKTNGLD